MPGQFVAVRGAPEGAQKPLAEAPPPPSNLGAHLFAIASSPYAVRRESADLDASIIEVRARSFMTMCHIPFALGSSLQLQLTAE